MPSMLSKTVGPTDFTDGKEYENNEGFMEYDSEDRDNSDDWDIYSLYNVIQLYLSMIRTTKCRIWL